MVWKGIQMIVTQDSIPIQLLVQPLCGAKTLMHACYNFLGMSENHTFTPYFFPLTPRSNSFFCRSDRL